MQVSGRVTNSFFNFLDRHHFDTSRLHEFTDIEIHFIKDPNIWMDIDSVESFLKKISNEYDHHFVDKDLITSVGHDALQLKSWGDLDQVLKMATTLDIYQKIDHILGWFISPIVLEDLKYTKKNVTFTCDLNYKSHPYISEYMRSVLESLSTFQSQPMTRAEWRGRHVRIDMNPFEQMSFFKENQDLLSKKKLMKITHPMIDQILAREILDSRGQPTLEVELRSSSSLVSRAAVPSGASKGFYEAHELRDQDDRFFGKGVLQACKNVEMLSKKMKGVSLHSLEYIDHTLLEIDGTENKTKLGANVLTGISLACAKMVAQVHQKPLYNLYNENYFTLPVPLINVINGGSHAGNNLDIQEFMLVPHGFSSFRRALQASSEVFQMLKSRLKKENKSTALGDEGGVAPDLSSNEEALKYLVESIEQAGYQVGEQIGLALDVAASSFFKNGYYHFENKKLKASDLISIYNSWIQKYPIQSIEDGLDENAWEDWAEWSKLQGDQIQIVGDDLFVTHSGRLQKGIQYKAANALLVKVNQIGTVSEARKAVQLARMNSYSSILSHRSGETEDTSIADLSLAFKCEQIKTGGVCRGERTAKYNRLFRIEEELGNSARYYSWPKKII